VRAQALTTYFQFLELRPTSMQPSPALPLRQPAWCSPYPAMHAARVGAILGVCLDDIDLGNHQLTIVGRVRPLDDLTRRVLVAWLDLGAVVGRTPPIRTCSSTSRLPRKPVQPAAAGPIRCCKAIPRLSSGRASTANSKKHWPTEPTRCTSRSYSAWTRRPRSTTPRRPGNCWKPRLSATPRQVVPVRLGRRSRRLAHLPSRPDLSADPQRPDGSWRI